MPVTSLPAEGARRARLPFPSWVGEWAGLLPFFVFALAFMILPAGVLLVGSFQDARGGFTLINVSHLLRPAILRSYLLTIEVSFVSAIGGALFGFLLAYSVTLGGASPAVRGILLTFSGVASNFAGVPLAFAFIATLGRVGLITTLVKAIFGISLYDAGFNLYSFWGLSLTYLYFQLPLMVLIITPALDGLRREWREASQNLGASTAQYWRHVALPILMPSLLSSIILLFGNAFGAYATAYALTGGLINLVPIQIGAQIRGDVLHDPNLGYALALGMVVVMTLSILGYSALQRRAARFMR
ncbi:MAG TPA: ABC transporter permease subunit [Spirochaetia bacterium]|nr:ABC transporter permease subunit [Spirochaetia bacterium]